MATMTIQNTNPGGDQSVPAVWQYDDSKAAAGNGAWVKVPPGRTVGVVLSSTGDGRVEVTFDDYAAIDAGSVATESIVVWDHGNIGVSKKAATISMASAFRQVNISGTTKMYAVAM